GHAYTNRSRGADGASSEGFAMVDVAHSTSYETAVPPLPAAGRHEVQRLSEWLEQFDRRRPWGEPRRITSGCAPLDQILPEHGVRSGSLVEWIGDGPGRGVRLLALRTAHGLQAEGGTIVVVDRQQRFYAPAAAAAGVNLPRTIVVRPTTDQDELWAIDQAMRCPHVEGVVAWPDRIDSYTFRRLQLAAEESGTLGLLVRPAAAEREPTWADVRLKVSP